MGREREGGWGGRRKEDGEGGESDGEGGESDGGWGGSDGEGEGRRMGRE